MGNLTMYYRIYRAPADTFSRQRHILARRPALPADAADLVDFTVEAGEGLPLVFWRDMAGPEGDPLEIGRERVQRTTGAFSYTLAEIGLIDDDVAGCIVDYRLGDMPEPVTSATPPLIAPLNTLENLVRGSWYVNILAVKPAWRRRGVARMLLEGAEARARAADCRELSIIVSDANVAARALYGRFGFVLRDARPMVKTGWSAPGATWLLMTKPLLGVL